MRTSNFSAENLKKKEKRVPKVGRQLSPRHGHVILISISKFDQWVPCFDSCQFTTTYLRNIRLQAPIQARESDNLQCVVQTGGQTYGQVTTKILAVDRSPNFLSYGTPPTSHLTGLLSIVSEAVS